ncbi:MAG: proteasome assembly chaperone family protein [Candidatus Hodarchaeales archaeon]|jgi:uncharacterized protein
MKKAETQIMGEELNQINASKIIIGFPGAGLVGSIAARHIAYELELEVKGFIRSPLIPTNALFFDGILQYPYRIYGSASEDPDIAICVGESPLSEEANFYIAKTILDWAETKSSSDLIVIDGFTSDTKLTEEIDSVFLIAEPDLWDKTQKMEKIKRAIDPEEIDLISGYISGVAGALLNETIIRPIDGYALLACCIDPKVPNAAGAAAVIEAINELKGLEIDVSGLLFQANRLKQKFSDLARQTHQIQHLGKPKARPGVYR